MIAEKGAVNARSGTVRALVDLRLRASQRLAQWLDRFGMNPQARAGIRRQLAEGGLAAEIAQRRKEPTGVVEARRLPGIDAHRAVLQAIAFGADPEVRPADRLQALKMLDDLGRAVRFEFERRVQERVAAARGLM